MAACTNAPVYAGVVVHAGPAMYTGAVAHAVAVVHAVDIAYMGIVGSKYETTPWATKGK